MKKTTLRHIIISLFKTSDKGKILKAAREKKTCITHRNEDKDNLRFPVGNNTSEKAAELHLEGAAEGRKLSVDDSSSRENTSQK